MFASPLPLWLLCFLLFINVTMLKANTMARQAVKNAGCNKKNAGDSVNNSFGNHLFNFKGRTQTYTEGYVHNTKMKPIICKHWVLF